MSIAAVFLADGFEEVEALTPVDYLRRAGTKVITVGVVGTPFNKTLIVNGSHNIPVIADITLDDYLKEFSGNLPDCVFCPGGLKGSENLMNTQKLLTHLEKCNEAGKIVSAICAAPSLVLGKTNVVVNKKWTCYPEMETESNLDYIPNHIKESVVTDGNLVTSRGAGTAEQFAMELVRLLEGEEKAKKVHDGTIQR